jgi:hypothetical protein
MEGKSTPEANNKYWRRPRRLAVLHWDKQSAQLTWQRHFFQTSSHE